MINHKKNCRRKVRGAKTRYVQFRQGVSRIIVHLTNKHSYVQLVSSDAKVLASASTAEKEMRAECKNGGNVAAAKLVGRRLAQKVQAIDPTQIEKMGKLGFDRNGFRYEGRVRGMAEAMRAEGLEF